MDGPQPALAVQWLERLLDMNKGGQAGYLTPTGGAASGGRWGRSPSKGGAGAHPPIPEEYSDSEMFMAEEENEGASLTRRRVSGSGVGGARITSVLPDGSRLPCATALEVVRRNSPGRGPGGEEEGGGEDPVSATYKQQLRVAAEEEAQGLPGGCMQRCGGGRMHRFTHTHTRTHAHTHAGTHAHECMCQHEGVHTHTHTHTHTRTHTHARKHAHAHARARHAPTLPR